MTTTKLPNQQINKVDTSVGITVSTKTLSVSFSKDILDASGNVVFPGEDKNYTLGANINDSTALKAAKATLMSAIEVAFGVFAQDPAVTVLS